MTWFFTAALRWLPSRRRAARQAEVIAAADARAIAAFDRGIAAALAASNNTPAGSAAA